MKTVFSSLVPMIDFDPKPVVPEGMRANLETFVGYVMFFGIVAVVIGGVIVGVNFLLGDRRNGGFGDVVEGVSKIVIAAVIITSVAGLIKVFI